jgi:hypothetical protein
MSRRALSVAAMLALPLLVAQADARVYVTQEEALRRAFPEPQKIERRVLYLDDAQAGRARARAGVAVESRVIPYYVGVAGERVEGYAYFDTHLVRTLPQTILILLAPDGRIRSIEIVSFDEPEDYLPGARWLAQFEGVEEGDTLSAGGPIHALTGATLSARAVTAAARRALAIHRLFVAPGRVVGGPTLPEGSGP